MEEVLATVAPKISAFSYFQKLSHLLQRLDIEKFDHAVNLIKSAWQQNKQIICFGNGGSALTAQHFINDWNKSIFKSSGRIFRGRSLTENMGLITAFANDVCYEDIFVEQLKYCMEEGDLVIGISGSGNSENVLRAIAYAKEKNNLTLGLIGFDGGKLLPMVDHFVHAPIHDMQIAEDIHFIFGHLVMQSLCGYQ